MLFWRWVKWVRCVRMKDKDVITLNMDETSMSGTNTCKHGMHMASRCPRTRHIAGTPRKRRRFTCSLMGLICDDDAVQPHLPQVVLPKYRNQETPPSKVQRLWSDTGSPIEAWHKTSGWNSSTCMRQWIRRVHARLRVLAPDRHVMLVMDCAQAHTCRRVLTQCRALKMSVVFIPGRCTWLLQPLDTHVFEKLKRVLRLERTKAAMTDAVGVVSDAVNIQAVGTAIHSTLVQKTWSTAMAQVGLGSTRTSLRQTLRHYVDDEEVSPRHPSVAELMFLMGRSTRTAIPWERLLFAPFEPHSFTDSPSAPAAAPSLAMEDSVQQPPARPWGRRASGSFHEDVLLHGAADRRPTRLARLPPAINVDVAHEAGQRSGPAAGTRAASRLLLSPAPVAVAAPP